MILDVVYNHTGEGNHLGPTLSMRSVDNPAYYRLVESDLRYDMDYTGTGNSRNVRHPHILQLIMDSMRYWVLETQILSSYRAAVVTHRRRHQNHCHRPVAGDPGACDMMPC